MKIDTTTETLPDCGVLAAFDEEDKCVLSSFGKFLVFRADEIVIKEEEEIQNCLYFVISGTLHALHIVKGGATPIGTINQGEWFGEVNIFDPNKASAQVVARNETHVWRISRARLEEFLNDQPTLGCLLLLGVSEVLARRARQLVAKLNATWECSW